MSQVHREIYAQAPILAAGLLPPLLNFLSMARDLLGGDAEKILIMLVVSLRAREPPDLVSLPRQELAGGDTLALPSLGVSVHAIADATGIPQETVRRKVGALVEGGFLARAGSDVRSTSEGDAAVGAVREAVERLALRNYEAIRGLVASGRP